MAKYSDNAKCVLQKAIYSLEWYLPQYVQASLYHRVELEDEKATKAAARQYDRRMRCRSGKPMKSSRLSNMAKTILKPCPRLIGKQAACCPISPPPHIVILVTAFEPAEQLGQKQDQSWWKGYQSWFSPYMPLDSKKQRQQPSSNTAFHKSTVQSSVTAAVSRVSKWFGL
jgi:hypothetical protein